MRQLINRIVYAQHTDVDVIESAIVNTIEKEAQQLFKTTKLPQTQSSPAEVNTDLVENFIYVKIPQEVSPQTLLDYATYKYTGIPEGFDKQVSMDLTFAGQKRDVEGKQVLRYEIVDYEWR